MYYRVYTEYKHFKKKAQVCRRRLFFQACPRQIEQYQHVDYLSRADPIPFFSLLTTSETDSGDAGCLRARNSRFGHLKL